MTALHLRLNVYQTIRKDKNRHEYHHQKLSEKKSSFRYLESCKVVAVFDVEIRCDKLINRLQV
jgi:hypothetical protein